jgi:hypothetical protein
MPRYLRRFLLACNAITFAYLLCHVHEPLRLNVGDPWADANLVVSVTQHVAASPGASVVPKSPLSVTVYGAIARLGVTDIGTFRLFALAFSALGAWALFHYLRRMWSDCVALLGTTLFTTSVLSIMHADSLQSPPLVHAACFIALWALIRALDTEQLRYYAVTAVGAFVCMFAASYDWLFLATGVLFTIYAKRGDPLARGNFRFVVVATGGILGLLVRPHAHVVSAAWHEPLDDKLVAPLVPLLTLAFSPMLWVGLACGAWRAVRAPSVRAALDDAISWLIVVAVMLVAVSVPPPGPPMLRVIAILPFFAIGSAVVIAPMLQADRLRRALGIAWIVVATAWSVGIVVRYPRAVLDRDDVAATRAYLANSDGNDFVISNLLCDGVIQAAFDRQSWSAIDDKDETDGHTSEGARLHVLGVLAAAGTDQLHAIVFTRPASRLADRSLGQLASARGLGPTTAWSYIYPSQANTRIEAYDAKLRQLLDATGAVRVLHFDTFDVFRIDRQTVIDRAGRSLPVTHRLELNSPASTRNKLLGWGGPRLSAMRQVGVSSVAGYSACADPLVERTAPPFGGAAGRALVPAVEARAGEPARSTCETVARQAELSVPDARSVSAAQLMIRLEHACDLRVSIEVEPVTLGFLADLTSPVLGISIGGYTASQCASSGKVSFVVPQRFVRDGVNLATFTTRSLDLLTPRADLRAIEVEPMCASPH